MTVPSVQAPERDGALGIQPLTSGLPMAIVGQCTSGPFNTPVLFARSKDVSDNFGAGRAAEAAAYCIERFQKPCIIVREETTETSVFGEIDDDNLTGTSEITLDESLDPNDDYQVRFRFPTGGTIEQAGITLQWSLDDGRTWSPVVPLGTAVDFTITEANVKIEFGAGTIGNGSEIAFTVQAPYADTTELAAALAALEATAIPWEFVHRAGFVSAAAAGVISAALDSMAAAGKLRHAIASFRVPDDGEDDPTYQAAFASAFGSFADSRIAICAGAAKVASSITRRRYRRPVGHPVAALVSAVSEEIDVAQVDVGRLPGVELRNALGNPDPGYHDEDANPGLDDMRALALRTIPGYQGVYVNNPRLISATGSDFDFVQKRRVMNLARTYVLFFFQRVLHRPLRINPKTGFLRESELQALEAECNAGLKRLIMAKPKASSVRVVLSRTDAITQPPYPLTGQLRMVPLAYPKSISIESGWALTEDFEITGVATA